jgi:hypothetical protein
MPITKRRRHHAHERHLVGDAERAVQVQRLGGDVVIDLGHRHLDRGDVLAHLVVVLVLVDQPGGAQHHQAELLSWIQLSAICSCTI